MVLKEEEEKNITAQTGCAKLIQYQNIVLHYIFSPLLCWLKQDAESPSVQGAVLNFTLTADLCVKTEKKNQCSILLFLDII